VLIAAGAVLAINSETHGEGAQCMKRVSRSQSEAAAGLLMLPLADTSNGGGGGDGGGDGDGGAVVEVEVEAALQRELMEFMITMRNDDDEFAKMIMEPGYTPAAILLITRGGLHDITLAERMHEYSQPVRGSQPLMFAYAGMMMMGGERTNGLPIDGAAAIVRRGAHCVLAVHAKPLDIGRSPGALKRPYRALAGKVAFDVHVCVPKTPPCAQNCPQIVIWSTIASNIMQISAPISIE